MRRPLIAGNWKMHTTYEQALELARAIQARCGMAEYAEVVLIPPFPWIVPLSQQLNGSSISLGAQTCSAFDEGAYTGEVSAKMVAPFCRYVIVGHSERRRLFGETDAVVAAKLRAVLRNGLQPILCVGETLEERESGATRDIVERQIAAACSDLESGQVARLVIAYEPVWAIGTGRPATSADAELVASWIRAWFRERFGSGISEGLRILYGGSVTAANAADFLAVGDIDGALVGGASLDAREFCSIVEAAVERAQHIAEGG
jgi:triosephosphate isomerase